MTLPPGLENKCGECLLFGAIQGLADALVLVDREGRIFHVNRRAEELLGLQASRVMGTRLRAALRHPGVVAFWDSAQSESDPVGADLTLPPRILIRATASVCVSAAGAPIGRALLLRDVTREKRIQVELSTSVARRLVDMAGGDEPPGDLPALTRRERQILELLAGGLSNATIAARLKVSPNTVASHLKHLYPKLGVSSRAQATAYALTRGIRPPAR
ncbi:MAG TPA: LuxR C-terminal-related transcriptional regulator [Candidatus Polarisedimenticolia bacterium]|nr:LuxR C-terminal-related transcriptional regulator [Candidatus Polarisedimenticolia bacterium]